MPPKKHAHKLTPEERKELRKQKRIEKKLNKIEKKKQQQRDHLTREITYGGLNTKNYEKNWREMLIKVALPRMREELEFAWHNFERAVDCKDFTISLLMDELRESEEQYMHNFRSHSDNLDRLMGIFHDRLDELRRDYDSEVGHMQDRCNDEFNDMKDVSNENLDYLKTMLYMLELDRKEHNRLKKGEYFSRLDQVEVNNQLLLQKLKAALEKKYQSIFDETQLFVKNYRKQIKDRKKEHNALKDQDDSLQELIMQQFRQIKKFYDTVRQLKHKYIDMKQTIGNQLTDLQCERQFFSNSFLLLKSKLEGDKQNDFDKLVRLSEGSSKAFDFLENLNVKGEKILNLAAVCRKLETKKEKIQPFPLSTTGLADDTDKNRDDQEDVEGVRQEMELFWQRMGQAYGTYYTLQKEKRCLTEENQLLVDTHSEYCENMMYPPIKSYKYKVAIPNMDGNAEIAKYQKFNARSRFVMDTRNKLPKDL